MPKPRIIIDENAPSAAIRIRARRPLLALIFFALWLLVWTAGGALAVIGLFQHFSASLCLWLGGWAAGWIFVATTLAWMLIGSETLRVVGDDLELGVRIGPWVGRKLYAIRRIENLRAIVRPTPPSRRRLPFPRAARRGRLQFNYGPRAIHAAHGLTQAEGELVLERLKRAFARVSSLS